ncbi:hypothetical protein TanjilG_21729 [Lupinus angustifolius]|uniref:Uncharacterized protein n=1 Tax=Lupinus angustifolius TaxID=3871 RepID=A0A1J7H5U9_LUPAN|nr:hypothetical protein TanjilG_21729 [Lupinus angustifolius]
MKAIQIVVDEKGFYIGEYTSRTEGNGLFGTCISNTWEGIRYATKRHLLEYTSVCIA